MSLESEFPYCVLHIVYRDRADGGRELREENKDSKAGFNATAAESLLKVLLIHVIFSLYSTV